MAEIKVEGNILCPPSSEMQIAQNANNREKKNNENEDKIDTTPQRESRLSAVGIDVDNSRNARQRLVLAEFFAIVLLP